ncbi:MAG: hypothetical protein ACJ74I_00290, partial [Gaiellaceae bacterium]
FSMRDNWQFVTILNHSGRDLVIDDIDPIDCDTNVDPTGCPNPPRPRVKENAPSGSADAKFSIVRQVDPTLITITNDHASGPKLVINGFIDNRIGETNVTNVFGPITSTTIRGGSSSFYSLYTSPHTSLIRSNIAHLYAGTSIGAANNCVYDHDHVTCLASQKLCVDSANQCVNVDLIVWANHPQELTTYSGTNTYLDLKTILRDSLLPNPLVTTPVIAIKSMVALDSIFVLLQPTTIQRMSPDVPGIDVQVVPDPSSLSSPPYYKTFFHPDGFRCDYPTGCPNPKRELGAYATDAETPVASTYNFLILDAGGGSAGVLGDVTVDAANTAPGATTINVIAYVDLHRTSGDIHIHTTGFITVTEKARTGGNPGDLRIAQIVSTNGDVTLYAAGAVLDADNDVLETGYDAVLAVGANDVSGADVVGRNITITAGDNTGAPFRNADPAAISGHGGVGVPSNFLEIVVDGVGGSLGVFKVTDTASERTGWNINSLPAADPGAPTGTFGVFVTQTNLEMEVDRILTNGDASLVALNGSLRDSRNGGAGLNTQFGLPNVEANNIDLAAYCGGSNDPAKCGNIGARAPPATGAEDDFLNDLKIDSGHGDTQHPSTVIVGRVGIEARNDVMVTETAGALNVLIAQSLSGNVRLTVREHATQGDDLNLILPYASDTIAPTQNGNAILIDYSGVANVKRDIGVGAAVLNTASINAPGWILLRVGDNVTLGGLDASGYPLLADAARIDQNTKVVAGAWIDIHGDYDAFTKGASELDSTFGTVMHLHGTITPGTLSVGCRDEINPGRDCNGTRIFGNTDTDTIYFDQTKLGGRTHVYGSRAMTCTAHDATCTNVWAPLGDSEDFFFVNRLQTMNVAAGHTLTLDGQDGTDTYIVNTTGTQACLGNDQISGATCHNYVINALDTGRPDKGADVLIVNGVDSAQNGYQADGKTPYAIDDIFLLRRSNFIGSTPSSGVANELADDPAFVALLHGNFGTATPVAALTDVNLTLCYDSAAGCEVGRRLTATSGAPFDATNFVVGRRIHLGNANALGDAGVWAGDYTVSSRAANGTYIVLGETLPTGVSLTTEQVPTANVALHHVSVGVLLGDVTTPDPSGDSNIRNQNYERINYDASINGRLIVNGLGGNDAFFSDDNSTITTLDGGLGNDKFRIGQIYGLQRDTLAAAANPVSSDGLTRDTTGGSLNPQDVFATVATTRGWLSAGASQPLVAEGDKGDDEFIVYSNQAPLRLEGGDDNDLFVVRGFALAQTKKNHGDPTAADCNPATASAADHCDIVWINAEDQIAMPRLTKGFSTAAESDIRTGSGTNQVEYNMNAPVSVDGGAGFDKLVILGTEYADHIVVTAKAVYGVGVSVTYANVEVLEIDALEGDDTIDVLSTAPGIVTRVIGGLGNDTLDVAGDVTGDVFSLDIEGTSGTINHAVSSDDPTYNGIVADGVDLSVARAGQGSVVITESAGFTAVYEGGCFGVPGTCTPVPALDSYTVALAAKPNCGAGVADADCKVYVTVSAAYPPNSEHPSLAHPYPDGPPGAGDGDTLLVTTTPFPGSAADFYRQIFLNGVSQQVSKRSIVLVFDGNNWQSAQTVYVYAVDDTRAEGTRVVTVSHSVIQPLCDATDATHCFDGAIVRNVEATIYDNDQPGVLLVQLDPNTGNPDNTTVALEGWGSTTALHPTTEQLDRYSIVLASAPTGTVVVRIELNDVSGDTRVCLISADGRFHSTDLFVDASDPTSCHSTGSVYTATFNSGNWFIPLLVDVHARNDFAPQDPHNTTLKHTIDASSSDAAYKTAKITERVEVLVIDDENPGVFVLPSDGTTVVVACGNDACTLPPNCTTHPEKCDTYQLRLNSAPAPGTEVKIALISDGQTDIDASSPLFDATRIPFEQVGGLQ